MLTKVWCCAVELINGAGLCLVDFDWCRAVGGLNSFELRLKVGYELLSSPELVMVVMFVQAYLLFVEITSPQPSSSHPSSHSPSRRRRPAAAAGHPPPLRRPSTSMSPILNRRPSSPLPSPSVGLPSPSQPDTTAIGPNFD
ncbi:hypothetical protein Droror1_Dr00007831 [Drosera rotundifolia]